MEALLADFIARCDNFTNLEIFYLGSQISQVAEISMKNLSTTILISTLNLMKKFSA